MNHLQNQRDELEALSEIYYNEIDGKYKHLMLSIKLSSIMSLTYYLACLVISDKTPISFSIVVKVQSTDQDYSYGATDDQSEGSDDEVSDDDDEEDEDFATQNSRSVNILFKLPTSYPDELPEVSILDSNNLDDDELEYILERLKQKARESLGTVMIFILVTDILEWLCNKSDDEAIELELEREKQRELDREECKRFDGTPVTEQNFLAWKAKFDAELLKAKISQQKLLAEQGSSNTNRLTGREMFESDKTLAESDLNFVEDLDQGQIEALMQNIDEFEIEEDVAFDVDKFGDVLDDEESEMSLTDEESDDK